MALTIIKKKEEPEKQPEKYHTADRRLYLTEDKTRLVEEGDPEAATLYAAPGDRIPIEQAQRFGLIDKGSGSSSGEKEVESVDQPEAKAVDQDEVKMKVIWPAENKRQ